MDKNSLLSEESCKTHAGQLPSELSRPDSKTVCTTYQKRSQNTPYSAIQAHPTQQHGAEGADKSIFIPPPKNESITTSVFNKDSYDNINHLLFRMLKYFYL